jgi:hypothetical protein
MESPVQEALVLRSEATHDEIQITSGVGHALPPRPQRAPWQPAAQRRRRRRAPAPGEMEEEQQQQQKEKKEQRQQQGERPAKRQRTLDTMLPAHA